MFSHAFGVVANPPRGVLGCLKYCGQEVFGYTVNQANVWLTGVVHAACLQNVGKYRRMISKSYGNSGYKDTMLIAERESLSEGHIRVIYRPQ